MLVIKNSSNKVILIFLDNNESFKQILWLKTLIQRIRRIGRFTALYPHGKQ